MTHLDRIILTHAENQPMFNALPITFGTFTQASRWLAAHRPTEGDGYLKHHFTIIWQDMVTQKIRFDLESGGTVDLAQHIIDSMHWLIAHANQYNVDTNAVQRFLIDRQIA
jgi:hypothetical protein